MLVDQDQKNFENSTIVDGFSIAELRRAFERVQDKADWKNPIDAFIGQADTTERRKIATAIEFFTGSRAEWISAQRRTKAVWTVQAPGYYQACGI